MARRKQENFEAVKGNFYLSAFSTIQGQRDTEMTSSIIFTDDMFIQAYGDSEMAFEFIETENDIATNFTLEKMMKALGVDSADGVVEAIDNLQEYGFHDAHDKPNVGKFIAKLSGKRQSQAPARFAEPMFA